MIHFEKEHFQKFRFSPSQIRRYFKSAKRDLEIAQKVDFAEVQFTFAYQALIKLGIALLAKSGQVKVRSVPGHHAKILIKMSQLLNDDEVLAVGDLMRVKRNNDLYSAGIPVSQKETLEYVEFVRKVFKKATACIL